MSIARHRSRIDSPIGALHLVASDSGLRRISWPHEVHTEHDGLGPDDAHPVLVDAARQLAEYFAGDRREFDLPLDLDGTDFQRQAWLALARFRL